MKSDDSTMRLADGGSLGNAQSGEMTGRTVFFFHGSGDSRLSGPINPGLLTRLGIRVISTDRPAHGLSNPKPDRTLVDWPDDVRQLAAHLGLDKFYVLGHSAGDPCPDLCSRNGGKSRSWGGRQRSRSTKSSRAVQRPSMAGCYFVIRNAPFSAANIRPAPKTSQTKKDESKDLGGKQAASLPLPIARYSRTRPFKRRSFGMFVRATALVVTAPSGVT